MLTRLTGLACILVFAGSALAKKDEQTLASARKQSVIAFHPLEKITVGPYDNFQGVYSEAHNVIFFTRLTNQAPRIYIHDLANDKVAPFLEEKADGKEPAVSPNGDMIAFTFYKKSSRGDICYKAYKADDYECIESQGTADSEAFWIDDQNLGYVSRNFKTDKTQIVQYSLATKQQTVLHNENAWAPSISRDGKTLVYSGYAKGKGNSNRVLYVKDLGTKKVSEVTFDLPGMSSYPKVGPDGKYLYFSQFLNDSNNDKSIDGNDNGVIFRIQVGDLTRKNILPEQLSSVENNCSYPNPGREKLLVTCAYQGSLDVYRIPVTGIVPQSWNEATLLNAHQVSRSYQDRILVLNTLRFRVPKYRNQEVNEQLLVNHLLLGESEASLYLINDIVGHAKDTNVKKLYKGVELWVEAEREKKLLPGGRLNSRFQSTISRFKKQINKTVSNANMRKILAGYFDGLLQRYVPAENVLKSIQLTDNDVPLVHFLYGKLAESFPGYPKYDPVRIHAYVRMAKSETVDQQTRIYYGVKLLEQIENNHSDDVTKRKLGVIALMKNFAKDSEINTLLNAEKICLDVRLAQDKDAKKEAFKAFEDIIRAQKTNYFLIKSVYVRGTKTLTQGDREDINIASFIASNWQNSTQKGDVEFAYARDVFSFSTMDKTYSTIALGKNQEKLARSIVYGSIGSTDDLESHYVFIDLGYRINDLAFIEKYYSAAIKRGDIGESAKYVEALRIVLGNDGDRANRIEKAIGILEDMDLSLNNPAMRFLLLGYCQLEKLQMERKGYEFDFELSERANRNLMLAYDLGRDNRRIQASALDNLSVLHFMTRNYSLASRYFQMRGDLGFNGTADELRFLWLYSKGSYFNRDYRLAAKSLERAAMLTKDKTKLAAFAERRAFYTLMSGQYPEAVKLYAGLSAYTYSDFNRGKIMLSEGYALYKAGQNSKAITLLNKAANHFKTQKPIPQEGERLVGYQPKRQLLIAYGLLARASKTPHDKITYRSQRLALLQDMVDSASDYYLKKGDVLRFVVKDNLNLALLAAQAGDVAQSRTYFSATLKSTEVLAEDGGMTDQGVIKTFENVFAFGIRDQKEILDRSHYANLKGLHEKYDATFADVKETQYPLFLQKARIGSLWLAFQHKMGMSSGNLNKMLARYLNQEEYNELPKLFEQQWQALQNFSKTIKM